jgi:hypothetical protein
MSGRDTSPDSTPRCYLCCWDCWGNSTSYKRYLVGYQGDNPKGGCDVRGHMSPGPYAGCTCTWECCQLLPSSPSNPAPMTVIHSTMFSYILWSCDSISVSFSFLDTRLYLYISWCYLGNPFPPALITTRISEQPLVWACTYPDRYCQSLISKLRYHLGYFASKHSDWKLAKWKNEKIKHVID